MIENGDQSGVKATDEQTSYTKAGLLALCRSEIGVELSEAALEQAKAALRDWIDCEDRFCGNDDLAVLDAFLSLCRGQRLRFRQDCSNLS